MYLEKLKSMSLKEIRNTYRVYLKNQKFSKSTIKTASSDTFYLWRNVCQEKFWRIIESVDFEKDARDELLTVLRENSKGNPDMLVNGYMSQMRCFLRFIHSDENQKNEVDIPVPSVEQVELYLKKWDGLENYYLQEDALNKLFLDMCPQNTDISDILVKAATLNDFYSTSIFSIYPVAKHILSLNIDSRLNCGDVTLVEDIQKVEIKGVKRNFYSFATKYCSRHRPSDYPMYDSYVEKVLLYFRNRDKFSKFIVKDLKDYVQFKRVLTDFIEFYNLKKYNFKLIDKYIWQIGKEYFQKNYRKE